MGTLLTETKWVYFKPCEKEGVLKCHSGWAYVPQNVCCWWFWFIPSYTDWSFKRY